MNFNVKQPHLWVFSLYVLGVSNSNEIVRERMLKSLQTHIHVHTPIPIHTAGEEDRARRRERYSHYRSSLRGTINETS